MTVLQDHNTNLPLPLPFPLPLPSWTVASFGCTQYDNDPPTVMRQNDMGACVTGHVKMALYLACTNWSSSRKFAYAVLGGLMVSSHRLNAPVIGTFSHYIDGPMLR